MKKIILITTAFSILGLAGCAGTFVKPDTSEKGFSAKLINRE